MTVMFPEFFGMPQSVIRTGLWARMRERERSLYTVLLHESERYCTRQFDRTDAQLSSIAGICPRSIREGRIKLQEFGLIIAKRGKGNVYTYTICNPDTHAPWPGDPKARIPYVKKLRQGNTSNAKASYSNPVTTGKPVPGMPLSFDVM